jgi:flagellar biosynthetic protein FliQ
MTLTFVPKLLAIVAVFWVSMGYMTQTLVALFQTKLIPIISGG